MGMYRFTYSLSRKGVVTLQTLYTGHGIEKMMCLCPNDVETYRGVFNRRFRSVIVLPLTEGTQKYKVKVTVSSDPLCALIRILIIQGTIIRVLLSVCICIFVLQYLTNPSGLQDHRVKAQEEGRVKY